MQWVARVLGGVFRIVVLSDVTLLQRSVDTFFVYFDAFNVSLIIFIFPTL